MVAAWAVIVMLFGHWLFDFVYQPHWMSLRKSNELWVLAQHSLRITAGALAVGVFVGCFQGTKIPVLGMVAFGFVNGAAHFVIDYFTSRRTSRQWREEKVHDFFVTIGFDQFLHLTIATATLLWVVS